MPPRKTKLSSSSQSSQTTTRTSGRKRKGSDASVQSERPASRQSNVSTGETPKKRRRGKAAASDAHSQPQVIVEEEEQVLASGPSEALLSDLACDTPSDFAIGGAEQVVEMDDTIQAESPHVRHVHFGSGPLSSPNERATATNITPHPRKMSIKRRVSTSPSTIDGNTTKRLRISSSRPSLPSSLSQSTDGANDDFGTVIQELQFAPLRAVLDERVRRRLRRSHLSEEQNAIEDHEKRNSRTQQELEALREEAFEREERLKDLTMELETQRQFAMSVSDEDAEEHRKMREMEAELAHLKYEMANSRIHIHIDENEVPDEDMLVLHDSQERVEYPKLPTPASELSAEMDTMAREVDGDELRMSQIFREGTSQVTISKARWEGERQKFEDAIMSLSREANDAKAALQILEIELQALGYAGDGAPATVIMSSIRSSFARIREDLEVALPGTIPENASNADIIEILIANTKEFAARLRKQDQELGDKNRLVTELGQQVNGLLNHLADYEIRISQLEAVRTELDEANDKKERNIAEFEGELEAAMDERDELQAALNVRIVELQTIQIERNELVINIEKLAASLEQYRLEETRLTELITRMEEEHRETIRKMNVEREETVNDLEIRLDATTEAKETAEDESDERRRTIDDLEAKFEVLETERDTLIIQLQDVKADFDGEKEVRERVEADFEEKVQVTEDLEQRVTNLEAELEELNGTIEELRLLNETATQQREAAENDLDDRNIEIDELNKKLAEAGVEANSIRMQLFGKQQEHEQIIKEMELQFSERDQQFQIDMSDEVARREAAEELAQEHAATILELETQLEELEISMRAQITERDERIGALEDELVQRDSEIDRLKEDLAAVEASGEEQLIESRERQDVLESSISSLQISINEYTTTITQLRNDQTRELDLHASEMEDRNAAIAALNANIAALQAQVDDLETQRASLEKRVEEEAEQMLSLQVEKDDEIAGLKALITDKQDKILAVELKVEQADQAYQDVLEAREEEIAMLKTQGVTTSRKMVAVEGEMTEIKRRFREYVRRSSGVISNLRAELGRVKGLADEEEEELRLFGEAEVEAVDAMNAFASFAAEETTTTTSSAAIASTGKSVSGSASGGGVVKKGRGRKKRVLDSGIGMDGEEQSLLE